MQVTQYENMGDLNFAVVSTSSRRNGSRMQHLSHLQWTRATAFAFADFHADIAAQLWPASKHIKARLGRHSFLTLRASELSISHSLVASAHH
jgi:hypothetical protein